MPEPSRDARLPLWFWAAWAAFALAVGIYAVATDRDALLGGAIVGFAASAALVLLGLCDRRRRSD